MGVSRRLEAFVDSAGYLWTDIVPLYPHSHAPSVSSIQKQTTRTNMKNSNETNNQ